MTLAAVAGEVVIPADGVWWERFDGEFLAFEADGVDLSAGNGWSVVVMGRATHLSSRTAWPGSMIGQRCPGRSSRVPATS